MIETVLKTQRQVFGETLVELGRRDPRLVVLDADVSSSTQTRLFGEAFPDRFFNFGIAEANMVSAAAGMSSCGLIPFVSTFALFISLRAGEQVRAQVAATGLNVKLVGGYAGLSDFADGASHQSVEDLAVMRAMPGMVVLAPSSALDTAAAVRAAFEHDGPVFLRISREAVTPEWGQADGFRIGRGARLRTGSDVTLVTTGTMLTMTMEAAEALGKEGVSAAVIHLPTLKPLDEPLLLSAARTSGAIVTIEEHSVIGGLGSAVCEAVSESCPVPVFRCGIPDRFGESGGYREILSRAGLDAASVAQTAHRAISLRRSRHAPDV